MDLAEFLLARIAEDEDLARMMLQMMGGNLDRLTGFASPSRALAECEAKRRIVATIQRWLDTGYPTLDHVLFALALPYASHPDYRSEWAP